MKKLRIILNIIFFAIVFAPIYPYYLCDYFEMNLVEGIIWVGSALTVLFVNEHFIKPRINEKDSSNLSVDGKD